MGISLTEIAAGVTILVGLIGLHLALTRDYREKRAQDRAEYELLEKKYLTSEQQREAEVKANMELIIDFVGQDRAFRQLRDENARLKDEIEDLRRKL